MEILPNEILLWIFSHLSWFELLTCLSSLNKRLDVVICSILSKNDNKSNRGLVIIEAGLSYRKCNSILLSLISNPLLPFASCIRRIHFDGTNCNSSDLNYKWLFDNYKKIVHSPNVKSVILTRCLLVEPLIKSLPILIKYQVDELRLTFDKDIIKLLQNPSRLSEIDLGRGNYLFLEYNKIIYLLREKLDIRILIFFLFLFIEKLTKLEELISELFSNESRLISLELDISCYDSSFDLHDCLKSRITRSSSSIFQRRPSCLTLRRLYICIKYTCFLEYLIEYVPVLEQLSVYFDDSFNLWHGSAIGNDTLQTYGNWFNKLRKKSEIIIALSYVVIIDFCDCFIVLYRS